MKAPDIPFTQDLVLVGGGHTHALVLRRWGMNPLPGARLTLVSPEPVAAYSGMVPGYLAGHYRRDELEIDLVKLARHAGARLVLGAANAIDLAAQTLSVPGRPPIAWDVLSLDVGVTSAMPDLPGFDDHGVTAKPLDRLADRWERFVAQGGGSVAVIGGGVAGTELAMAARYRLGPGPAVIVVEAGQALSEIGAGARRAVMQAMRKADVTLIEGNGAVEISGDGVRLADGSFRQADLVIGAATARPQAWLAGTGLPLADGFVAVGPTLQSVGAPRVFAAGDTAQMIETPRPRAGVFAVRQAPVLYRNLQSALAGRGAMQPYRPQRDYLRLISTGSRSAVADKWGLTLSGPAIWHWKDRVDRRFMDRFAALQPMQRAGLRGPVAAGVPGEIGSGQPPCAGCGAKMGRQPLDAVLAGLPRPRRTDVLSGPGDDAAVLRVGDALQVVTTDHLRGFTEDAWLMARIAAVHALGDIWAMGAAPQAALAQIILPRMSPRLQERTLREIMDAAVGVFGVEGADLVGGHTSLGAELTIGFGVTGLAGANPIGQGGAIPGDAIILTKPLGVGTILAAEMARAAPGRSVRAAQESMARPQGEAAAILARTARAMTDVTGFGLAGHLLGILEQSGTAARLDLSAIPLLPGAVELAAAGHASSLAPANRSVARFMTFAEGPRAALLFDPQTSGGLLAAVPGEAAKQTLAEVRRTGMAAAIVGRVEEGPPSITIED